MGEFRRLREESGSRTRAAERGSSAVEDEAGERETAGGLVFRSDVLDDTRRNDRESRLDASTGITLLVALVVGSTIVLTSIFCNVDPFWLTVDEIRTRARAVGPYAWSWIAAVVAVNVVVATMYLGIHWLIDVIAGGRSGVRSVLAATYAVDRADTGGGDSGNLGHPSG